MPCGGDAARRLRVSSCMVAHSGALCALALMAIALAGCSPDPIGGPLPLRDARDLQPVSLPDLSRVHPAVQAQARDRFAALEEKLNDPATPLTDLGGAYGELGMILQAAGYLDAAEAPYINAQAIEPGDPRWPYYLAHLHTDRGELEQAEDAYARVLELRPNDLATLIWLGRLYLNQARIDEAEQMFTRAYGIAPAAIAVLAGLGRTRLDRQEFAEAVTYLERALTIDPTADSLHSPLAIAYRALGQPARAEPHLRQWSNRDIPVPDPLYQQLEMLLETGLSYELRGMRALEAKDWTSAVDHFRTGLELTPGNTALRRSLQHKLGTALYLAGDPAGAREQFEQVVRASPEGGIDEAAARGHYSLGVLVMSTGSPQEALEYLDAAVRYQPSYVEARLALADALRRAGRTEASLAHYTEAIRLDPRAAQGRFGYAMALIRLRRHEQARDWLADAMTVHPDRPEFAHMLARLLAIAPDDPLRDGERAMALLEQLFHGPKTTALGETLAMALAQLGEYEEAAAIQRGVLDVVRHAGRPAAVRRLAENLRLYEQRQPCRVFWEDDEHATDAGLQLLPPRSSLDATR